MEQPITAVIGGLGVRGYEVYASAARRNPDKIRIVVADPAKRTAAREAFGLAEESCYESMEALLEAPRLGDVAVIATQDRQHVRHAVPALEKGYHLLLEKPVSPDLQECLSLRGAAHKYQRIVAVAHVLRYTQIFSTVKQLLDANAIGRLIHMDLIEKVAYWHFAHSYVRGNWRRAGEASPMILAKSCHDLDLLRWLAGDTCISLSSVGGLSVFFAQNAPKGAARRGTECRSAAIAPIMPCSLMDNEKTGILHGNTEWPCSVLDVYPTPENVRRALEQGPRTLRICV
ncbi:MAG: Gfo/Idh/MocA family protein [Ruthenibacterium lactatiformans]